jgi:putative oxidoreductase
MKWMMLEIINPFFPYALLFLRIIVAIIFFSSGVSHVKRPSKRTDLPPMLTVLLGLVEIIAPVMIAVGIFVQIGAMMLIIVMLGAIYKKIFVWNIGFYSSDSLGWHYDLLLLCANLVFLSGGGRLILIG